MQKMVLRDVTAHGRPTLTVRSNVSPSKLDKTAGQHMMADLEHR